MNTMSYRGYTGSVEFSREDGILWGRVLGIRHMIDYEGESVAELERDFHNAIDHYLTICKEENIKPNRPSPDKITIPIPLDIAATLAQIEGRTGQSPRELILDAVKTVYMPTPEKSKRGERQTRKNASISKRKAVAQKA